MSVTAMITGRLVADPERRTSRGGNEYTLARVSSATEGDDSVVVSVIAFGTVADQLLELGKGDSVSLTGSAKPTAWLREGEPRAGLSLTAHALLTQYHVRKRRAAMAEAEAQEGGAAGDGSTPGAGGLR